MSLENFCYLNNSTNSTDNIILLIDNLENKCQFLYFYEIEMVQWIVDNNFYVYRFNIDNNKIYIDIGQSIIDNVFKLFLLYINKNDLTTILPKNNNLDNKSIINIFIDYFILDMNILLVTGYDINRVNNLYLINNNIFNYNNEKVSLLGYFIYTFVEYFFEINDSDNNFIKYDMLYNFIAKIFTYLFRYKCNQNIINHFPDNNIMSISSYILLSITKFNDKRLNLMKEKYNFMKEKINNFKNNNNIIENSSVFTFEQCSEKIILSTDLSNDNNCKKRKYKDDIIVYSEEIFKNKYDKIKRILSLLTWMFDIFMNNKDTINSEIISINYNDKEYKNIKNLKDLIFSEIIVKECRDFILKKYKIE
jgi:hypothetical protein